jgi:hypothetical protein
MMHYKSLDNPDQCCDGNCLYPVTEQRPVLHEAIALVTTFILLIAVGIGTTVFSPKAEGVGIAMEPVTVRDLFAATQLIRGFSPEDAFKLADKAMKVREGRK